MILFLERFDFGIACACERDLEVSLPERCIGQLSIDDVGGELVCTLFRCQNLRRVQRERLVNAILHTISAAKICLLRALIDWLYRWLHDAVEMMQKYSGAARL